MPRPWQTEGEREAWSYGVSWGIWITAVAIDQKCSAPCLFADPGRDDFCTCRCGGRFHGAARLDQQAGAPLHNLTQSALDHHHPEQDSPPLGANVTLSEN